MKGPKRLSAAAVESMVADISRELGQVDQGTLQRIDCDSEGVEKGLARLVLSLVELLRRLLERQAIRRMEGGELPDGKVEEMGAALMKLEEKIGELAAAFGLKPEELNLDLGPLGTLWKDD